MSVITTGSTPKALWPIVRAWWGRDYDEHQPEWPDLFEQETSEHAYEEDVQTTGFPLAQVKGQGASIAYASEHQGFTSRYTHVTWALGYMVTMEEQQDNKAEAVARRRTKALAFSVRQAHEINCANIYNRAGTAAYTGGDGVTLLNTAHPAEGGAWSNKLTVDADLSESSLEDLLTLIMKMKSPIGHQIKLMAKSLHVPAELYFEAHRILKSALQYDSANNAVNVLKLVNAIPEGIKVNHYFTDPDAYFVRTNCPNGMMHFQRMAINFDEDNDFDTKNLKYAAMERYAPGWTDPRGLVGSLGA